MLSRNRLALVALSALIVRRARCRSRRSTRTRSLDQTVLLLLFVLGGLLSAAMIGLFQKFRARAQDAFLLALLEQVLH